MAHATSSPMERQVAAPLLRPGFAIRERLDRRVDASPVLALVAPAGWGKTQLMVHLFRRALQRGEAAVWLSLPRTTNGGVSVRHLRAAAFPEAAGFADLDDLLRLLTKRPRALFVDDVYRRARPARRNRRQASRRQPPNPRGTHRIAARRQPARRG